MDTPRGHQRALVHPAIGFVRVPDTSGPVWALGHEELGADWAALSDEEAGQAEERFFAWLFAELGSTGAVITEIDLPFPGEHVAFGLTTPNLSAADDPVSLQPAGVEVLVTLNPVILVAQRDDQMVLFLHDGWTGVQLALPPQELNALEATARERRLIR